MNIESIVMSRVVSRSASIALAVIASITPAAARAQTVPSAGAQHSAIQVAKALGKEVRVTSLDGSKRKGLLVSLSATEVVVRERGNEASIPLGEVGKVERVAHHVRKGTLLGAAVAAVALTAVMLGNCGDADGCETALPVALMFGGAFVGIGAGIGALNAANAHRHPLYLAPPSPTRFSVALILGPQRAGVGVAKRW